MTVYRIFRENFQADTWDPVWSTVSATTPERAIRSVIGSGGTDIYGTYVAIPIDELTQFMEGRTTAHVDVLEPVTQE